jgi:V/A-type H+-transporting ATPase subunit D
MARLALNKASLTRQNRQLSTYQEFLPSLDMKRQALLAEQATARQELRAQRAKLKAVSPQVAEKLPMLSDERIDLRRLVRIARVVLGDENLMGVRLPVLESLDLEVPDYALLGKPHWVDPLVAYLKKALELRLQIKIAERRLEVLDDAVRTITQRVNLFEKVLIPRARSNIKRIRIHLSDQERAAVVRAKLAKSKKQAGR